MTPDRLPYARTRIIAWSVLLALAALQAWMFRHSVQPDGIAYLDLSDAVRYGRFNELINGYWSPVYPILLGVVRLAVSATPLGDPYWEFALAHIVNFMAFAASLVAFEWFLLGLDEAGTRWGQQLFRSPLARGFAYALFGTMSLVMISLKAVTPDLLVSAITFAIFGRLVRLRTNPDDSRTAITLGALLAIGALTKSFLFPWAIVALITLAIATRSTPNGKQRLLQTISVFVLATLPWCVALSLSLGHPTFGETGRLNYAWWVNEQQRPQNGDMPRLAAPDSLPLDGIAVMQRARGTNPLWYDPVRWNRDTRPRFSVAQQSARFSWSLAYYVGLTAPLLFVVLVLGISAEPRAVRVTILRSFPVLLPSVVALGAYALVFAAARYLAPYVVGAILALAAAFPKDAMLRPSRLALGTSLSLLAIDALSSMRGRVFLTYGVALFIAAWFAVRAQRRASPWLLASVTAIVLLWLVAQLPMAIVQSATLITGLLLLIHLSRSTDMLGPTSAAMLRRDLAVVAVIVASVPGLLDGYRALSRWRERPTGDANAEWSAAQQAIRAGTPPGAKIAVVGSPYDVGWARLARYQIVGVVPESRSEAFWKLSERDRRRILRAFSDAGATRLIANPTRSP